MKKFIIIVVAVLNQFIIMNFALANDSNFKLAVTTSFHNSGLSDVLVPELEKDTGIIVDLLVVGTGQALKLGSRGDVDAILVHSKMAEEAFVENGFAPYRREIMYNDFVLIGSKSDPAAIKNLKNLSDLCFIIVVATLGLIRISLPKIRTKLNVMNYMSALGKMEV